MKGIGIISFSAALFFSCSFAFSQDQSGGAHENYVMNSKDFKPVRQEKDWALKAYPSWVIMPWYYQWTIGFDDASGEFCRKTGINGAFVDRGNAGYLGWIDKYGLKFYMDHAAGKGDLHMWDGDKFAPYKDLIAGAALRVKPVNDQMKRKLEAQISRSINAIKASPNRAAYALDDELSWGHFVKPCMWNLTDDSTAYKKWLDEIYGGKAPERSRWIGYDEIWPKLSSWNVAGFDASPLMDQWTFNDSYWNNFIGDLVEYANSVDPATPCGYVGGQGPSPFGGYDYAKIMGKVQYLEAYNIGEAQSIIRSLNPKNALPTVTSYFHKSTADGIWQMWYYLAQGNRGHIAWVEKWFDGKTPKPWLSEIAPTLNEVGGKIGPMLSGSDWLHDGVAIYYSHASIQLSWIMDAQAHGKTWKNRKEGRLVGSAARNRKAWTNMLRDEGLQFNWISYADVVRSGIPKEYKVLILPAVFCLSDVEARKISEFAKAGGVVIADYLPGLWDQHGKGRAGGGVLDKLFAVKHDPMMTAKDLFNGDGKLWCEVDEDVNFSCESPSQFFSTKNTCIEDSSGFHKAVRGMGVGTVANAGKGKAVLMNLSAQKYILHRNGGRSEASKRSVFMKHLRDAGIARWVSLDENSDGSEFGYEFTYWTKGNRTFLFLIANNEVAANSLGGGEAVGLSEKVLPVTIRFSGKAGNIRDERSGKNLGDLAEIKTDWKKNEAIVLSLDKGSWKAR